MSQETFWTLLSKKLADEATAEEIKQLESLITEHPEWQYAIQNLEDLWKHEPSKDNTPEEDAYMLHLHRMADLNIPFGETQADMPAQAKKKTLRWYWAAAACIIGVLGYFLFAGKLNAGKEKPQLAKQVNEISTKPGSKSRVQLPDGTVVMLNAGSKLSYGKDFGKELREVSLTGEGFFDVTKMPDKPFIIHTSSINIKVLGTVFNVKAYPEDKKTETSLLKGRIEVTIKNRPNDKIILLPSEKLTVENGVVLNKEEIKTEAGNVVIPEQAISPLMSINKLKYGVEDSTVAETEWINNRLVFNDESLEELAVRMERWYDVKISIRDERLKEKRLTGNFERENIDQALEALKYMIRFRFEKTGTNIIIHR